MKKNTRNTAVGAGAFPLTAGCRAGEKNSRGKKQQNILEAHTNKKSALIVASVASMIDQFNIPNIKLLIGLGYNTDVAANFIRGSTCTDEKVQELLALLDGLHVDCYQIDFDRNVADVSANIRAFKQLDNVVKGKAMPINFSRHHHVNPENGAAYTFIHSHSPIGGVVGRIIGKKNGIKNIYTAHGFHFYNGAPKKNWLVYYPVEKYLSWITDVLITINKEDYHRAKKHFHAKKTVYIPGVGVDMEKFNSGLVDSEKKRKELGVNPDTILLLSVGELTPRKNHEVVIRALGQFKEDNFVYLIAGKGELEAGLKSLSHSLGIDKRVKFLGFRTDISSLCQAADLFIFPSCQEGLPLALMEAIACGTPVVCSNIRGNTDLVRSRDYVFDENSVDDVARVLMPMLRSSRKSLKMRMEGIVKKNKTVLKDYDLNTVENRMNAEFESMGGYSEG